MLRFRAAALGLWAILQASHGQAGELEDLLDESVGMLNGYVPFQIDLTTRLTGISRDQRTLVYDYLVERVQPGTMARHAPVLGRRTCANRDLLYLLSRGGSVRYSYRFKESDDRVIHEITHAACQSDGVAL